MLLHFNWALRGLESRCRGRESLSTPFLQRELGWYNHLSMYLYSQHQKRRWSSHALRQKARSGGRGRPHWFRGQLPRTELLLGRLKHGELSSWTICRGPWLADKSKMHLLETLSHSQLRRSFQMYSLANQFRLYGHGHRLWWRMVDGEKVWIQMHLFFQCRSCKHTHMCASSGNTMRLGQGRRDFWKLFLLHTIC